MKLNNEFSAHHSYNVTVQQSFKTILKYTKQLLSQVKDEGLRLYYERIRKEVYPNTILHEMISPLLYLRLECNVRGKCTIHFGIESIRDHEELQLITGKFLRYIFFCTAALHTTENIEDCVNTDWFIAICTELFEYINMDQKYHILKKVPYKAPSTKAKGLLSVA
jgi:hypothetical protein